MANGSCARDNYWGSKAETNGNAAVQEQPPPVAVNPDGDIDMAE